MRKHVHTAAIALAIVSFAMPARADQTATFANVIAVESAIDVAQTESLLTLPPRCRDYPDPQIPQRTIEQVCTHPNTENDPFARPFVHSPVVAIGAAAAVNVGLRELGEHSEIARVGLGVVAALYPFVLIHNARVIHIALTFHP